MSAIGWPVQRRVELLHAVDGPEEIHRGWAGGSERFADAREFRIEIRRTGFQDAERDAHRRGYANGRGAANDHGLDSIGDFKVVHTCDEYLLAREARLIDHDHTRAGPLNGFYHAISAPPADCGKGLE